MSNLREMAFSFYMKLSNAENCGSDNKNNGIFIDVVRRINNDYNLIN